MARKPRDARDMSDQEVANGFINFQRNYTYAGVMEVVYLAAQLEESLEEAATAHERCDTFDQAAEAIVHSARRMVEARARRDLIAATVHRFAFTSGSFGDGDDWDPDLTRSGAVTEILLRHASERNRKQRGPLPGDEA